MSAINVAPVALDQAAFPDGINATLSDTAIIPASLIQAQTTGVVRYVSGKSQTTATWTVPYAGALLRCPVVAILSTNTTVVATAIQVYSN